MEATFGTLFVVISLKTEAQCANLAAVPRGVHVPHLESSTLITLLMRSSTIRALAVLASVAGTIAPLLVPGAARADDTPPLTVLRPEPTSSCA